MTEEHDDSDVTINKIDEFIQLIESSSIFSNPESLITSAFDAHDQIIKSKHKTITQGALSNAHGDWYEWILAIEAWNMFARKEVDYLALVLPNIRRFDVGKLYQNELSLLIQDLRDKVKDYTGVSLVTSNPDFVIVGENDMRIRDSIAEHEITSFDRSSIELLDQSYLYFQGKCSFNDIIGYMSVKTSLRPDRRLQIPHEGSLMKAIYAHMQTRMWIIKPKGIKYYAISTKVNDADRNGLATVATHSITNVSDLPIPAVDGVFECNSISSIRKHFKTILSRC